MDLLLKYSQKKITSVSLKFKRYLFEKISYNDEKIKGIIGLRGIGKTTLLLQLAREYKNSVYFSMDSTFIKGKSIFYIIEELYDEYGIKYFFIDEIHKYNNWEQDLKTIYDFFDDIKIVFSGSSSINLVKGNYDLSRRSLLFKLDKFSFKEYLEFKYDIIFDYIDFNTLIKDFKKISLYIYNKESQILKYYKEYLEYGELGFFLNIDKENYQEKLGNIINKIIYEDITNFYKLKTEKLYYFHIILKFIANSSPSKINYSNIATLLETTPDTVKSYINILVEIGLLNTFGKEGKISINLRKTKKITFELVNLLGIYFDQINGENNLGTIRENFIVSILNKNGKIYYPEKGDILFINQNIKYIFEVGGKNKTNKQIKNIDNAFLIKDDINIGNKNEIPIWLFGFLNY